MGRSVLRPCMIGAYEVDRLVGVGGDGSRGADGRVGSTGAASFDVTGELPHERSVGIDRERKVVPAGGFAQVADIRRAVARMETLGVGLAGVGVDDADFDSAGAMVAEDENDALLVVIIEG